MKYEDLENKLNSMQEKLGQDSSNLILDDIAELLNDNKVMNETLNKKDEEITKLNKDKETLQKVNGNLLMQVSLGPDPDDKQEPVTGPQIIDLRTAFDENRKF